jgi:hypothetical protein
MARILPASGVALLACLAAPTAGGAQDDDPHQVAIVTAPSPFGGHVYRPDPVAGRITAVGEEPPTPRHGAPRSGGPG